MEARSGRYHRGPDLAPEPWAAARAGLEQQAGHPEERLAQKQASEAGCHLIVDRGDRALAGVLPQQAAAHRVGGGLPEAESRGARKSLIDRALIRMQELVGGELVASHDSVPSA